MASLLSRISYPPALRSLAGAALLAPALAGCIASVDGEQARICRATLPALNSGATAIEVLRETPGTLPRSLRIEYRIDEGARARKRSVTCLFAAEGLARSRADLVGLATEDGPVSEASFYLLRRFYLETPDGVANTPAPPRDSSALPELPFPLAYGLQHFAAGAPRTAIYGLLAAGYALVFGLVRRFNLAYGEIAAIGAAAAGLGALIPARLGFGAPAVGIAFAFAFAIFAAGLHGLIAGRMTLSPVPGSERANLIATVGLAIALSEALRLVQGTTIPWLPPIFSEGTVVARAGDFPVAVSPMSLATTGLGFLAASGLLLAMRRTAFGRAWRAYANDPLAAALFGVDPRRLLATSLLIAGALAGLAGALVVLQFGGLGFAGGFPLGLKALIAAILGGVASVGGAFAGGLAIGLFETFWSAYLPIDARDIALYAMLALVIVLKPGGVFGPSAAAPRAV